MENKNLKTRFKNKRGFALFLTIFLIAIFFLFTFSIVQSNVFQSNLNKLKYMNLQANIHYDYIKKYIEEHNDKEIKSFIIKDNRFTLDIKSQTQNNRKIYYVIIEAKDNIPIRLSKKIIK